MAPSAKNRWKEAAAAMQPCLPPSLLGRKAGATNARCRALGLHIDASQYSLPTVHLRQTLLTTTMSSQSSVSWWLADSVAAPKSNHFEFSRRDSPMLRHHRNMHRLARPQSFLMLQCRVVFAHSRCRSLQPLFVSIYLIFAFLHRSTQFRARRTAPLRSTSIHFFTHIFFITASPV